ncbi:hypothetical protein AAIH40_33760, partial [Pseudomonas aeruginosa]
TCVIERQNGSKTHEVESEVVGFNGQRLFLMPLEEVEGVLPGARVYAKNISAEGLQSGKQLPLGPALLGRVLDGSGKPLDGLPSPDTTETGALITPPFNPIMIQHADTTRVHTDNLTDIRLLHITDHKRQQCLIPRILMMVSLFTLIHLTIKIQY